MVVMSLARERDKQTAEWQQGLAATQIGLLHLAMLLHHFTATRALVRHAPINAIEKLW